MLLSVLIFLIDNLKLFFREQALTFRTFPFVPERYKKEFFKSSSIKKIALIKRRVPDNVRDKFSPIIAEDEDFEIVLELRRLNKNPENFRETINQTITMARNFFTANLSDLGIDNREDFEMRFYYEYDKGIITYAKLTTDFDILPSIDLPDDIKEKGKDSPDLENINRYCRQLLEGIKDELLKDE